MVWTPEAKQSMLDTLPKHLTGKYQINENWQGTQKSPSIVGFLSGQFQESLRHWLEKLQHWCKPQWIRTPILNNDKMRNNSLVKSEFLSAMNYFSSEAQGR